MFQDEVQPVHWGQDQVALFTVAIWTKGADNPVCESHVIISDDMVHDKKSVAVFMSQMFDKFIKKRQSNVKCVYIFSHWPRLQF